MIDNNTASVGEVISPARPSSFAETTRPEMVDMFATDELVPVKIPGTDFTVMLQRELDWGQQAELEASALRGIEREQLREAVNTNQTIVLDMSKQRMMSLALRVVKWNVRRQNPETKEWIPVPLPAHLTDRMQVMRRLRPKWARTLLTEIEKLDKENEEGEPDMPQLMAPTDEQDAPPKATQNGVTEGQLVT